MAMNSSPEMQIPFVRGAIVPYGESSLLYIGGVHLTESHTFDGNSNTIWQFDGNEMRAKVFRYATEFKPPSQVTIYFVLIYLGNQSNKLIDKRVLC